MKSVSRLITQFKPEHYELILDLDRTNRHFTGVVSISGNILDETFALHAKDLTIESVAVNGRTAAFDLNEDDELIITPKLVSDGDHIVVVAFSGSITDSMHGLYPSYYQHDGQKRELLATQFESHHAREVFPCVDEPEAKATFDLTLTTEPGVVVLGNMPIIQQHNEEAGLVTTFETTPRMSTYLLAWVIGDLHKTSAITSSGTEVNIWATKEQPLESLDFALEVATGAIEFYNDYFGTPYPLPKSDHVALPDFSSGAMENWGLITYREIALLADPSTISVSSKQYIATVISHELAHQWFGNLVTMKWWNDLWLNESFATLMEYITVDALYPEWNIWLDFATNESIAALRRDSLDGVQTVQEDVNHPDEISTLFDGAIVYAKGARLLRMLQHYVGDTLFQKSLQYYFKQHAYSNTEASDLWSAIKETSGIEVAELMHSWLAQPGYPVLHVSKEGADITLRQEQFFVGPHVPSDRQWQIPLNSSCSEMPTLLREREVVVTRHHTTPLRFNVGDTAHFITHYDESLLAQLLDQIKNGAFSPLDRVQLLDEATLLARGGILPTYQLIHLLDAYRHETSEAVWNIIAITLAELRKFIDGDEAAERKLRSFSQSVAHEEYERLGWTKKENESEEDTKLRSIIISMTLYGEEPDALAMARHLYVTTPLEELDPELRSLILSSVVRYGDGSIVDTLLRTYKVTSSADLRSDLCLGITSTRLPEKIDELLATIKDTTIVRPQDAARWFFALIRGKESREQAWQWIRDNWQWVIDTFSGDMTYDDYPRLAASSLNTAQQLQQYRDFFIPLQTLPALTRVIELGLAEIEGRIDLIERDKETVRKTLRELS